MPDHDVPTADVPQQVRDDATGQADVSAWGIARLVAVATILASGAFLFPASPSLLYWPYTILDLVAVGALVVLVADLMLRGFFWPPLPLVAISVVGAIAAAPALAQGDLVGHAVVYEFAVVEQLVLLWALASLLRGETERRVVLVIGAWVVALLLPCLLLWLRVPGFLPIEKLDPASGDYISYFARLSHPYIGRSNNIAVLFVVFVIPLAVWGTRRSSWLGKAVATLALVCVVLTLSRGTLVALGFGFVLLGALAWKDLVGLWRWALAAAVTAVVGVVLMILANPASRMHIGDRLNGSNVDARGDLFSTAVSDIQRNPLWGNGPGVLPSGHNIVLQQLVDFGVIVGSVMVALLVASVMWWFWPLTGRSAEVRLSPSWLRIACGVGVALQVGSCLVEASYEWGALRELMWISWALLFALLRAAAADESTSPTLGSTAESSRSHQALSPLLSRERS